MIAAWQPKNGCLRACFAAFAPSAVSSCSRSTAPRGRATLPYTRPVRILSRFWLLLVLLACPVALSGAGRIPTPESVLGFRPGADYKLATYDQSVDYFKKVAAASKYVKLVEAGKTSQGRTI